MVRRQSRKRGANNMKSDAGAGWGVDPVPQAWTAVLNSYLDQTRPATLSDLTVLPVDEPRNANVGSVRRSYAVSPPRLSCQRFM